MEVSVIVWVRYRFKVRIWVVIMCVGVKFVFWECELSGF